MKFDFLIVGSGLFGATFAHQVKKMGKTVLVLEKRMQKGGNVYCENIGGINVHKYGPHIFHTSDKGIWDFVNQHVEFNSYIHAPLACSKGKLYNLPFNMNTFYQMWGVKTPEDAQKKIIEQINDANLKAPKNLEEQAISLVGTDIYEKLIKGYTEKQWGRSPIDLPAFIIKRLPVRFTYNNNYFNDQYQGIPKGGYNIMIESLLKDIEVRVGVDFLKDRDYWESISDKILYTGALDEFFNYSYGVLEYRSLDFISQDLDIENYQGVSIVNYTEAEIPFTRIVEHKHFEGVATSHTVITHEYPKAWSKGSEPFYPINDQKNNLIHNVYKEKAKLLTNYVFGGRLAEYKYYDMHQVIGSALARSKKFFEI